MITMFMIGVTVGMGITNLIWIVCYNPNPKLAFGLIVLQVFALAFFAGTGRIRAWMQGEKGFKP